MNIPQSQSPLARASSPQEEHAFRNGPRITAIETLVPHDIMPGLVLLRIHTDAGSGKRRAGDRPRRVLLCPSRRRRDAARLDGPPAARRRCHGDRKPLAIPLRAIRRVRSQRLRAPCDLRHRRGTVGHPRPAHGSADLEAARRPSQRRGAGLQQLRWTDLWPTTSRCSRQSRLARSRRSREAGTARRQLQQHSPSGRPGRGTAGARATPR